MRTNKTAFQDYFTPKKRMESFGITRSQTLTTLNVKMDYNTFTQQLLAAANAPTARDEAAATKTAPTVPEVNGMPKDAVPKKNETIKAQVNPSAESLFTASRPKVESKKAQVTRSTVHTAIHQMFQEDQSSSEDDTKDPLVNGPALPAFPSAREKEPNATLSRDIFDLETEDGDAIVSRWLKSTNESLEEASPHEDVPANTSAMDKEQQRKERKRISNHNWYQRKKAQEAMELQQSAVKATTARKAVPSKTMPKTTVQKANATKVTSSTAPKHNLSNATAPKNPVSKAVATNTTAPKAIASKTKALKAKAPNTPAPQKMISEKPSKRTMPHARITKRKFGMFKSWTSDDVVVPSDSDSNAEEEKMVKSSASSNLSGNDNPNTYPSPKPTATKSKGKQRNRSAVKDTTQVVHDRGTSPAQPREQKGEGESQKFGASTTVQSWLDTVEEEQPSRRKLDHILIPGHGMADNGSSTDSVLGHEEVVRDDSVVKPVQGTGGHGSGGLSHGKMESAGGKGSKHDHDSAARTGLRSSMKRWRDGEDANVAVRQSKRLKGKGGTIAGRREVMVVIDDKVDVASYKSFD